MPQNFFQKKTTLPGTFAQENAKWEKFEISNMETHLNWLKPGKK